MNEILRILVVEDNPADAAFIQEMLPRAGPVSFKIESVARLSAALARLQRNGVDLVLLDLGLPDSQGLPTFHKLRQAVPTVPVVVLTGANDEEMAVRAVRDGAQDYLVKGQVQGPLLVLAARLAIERKSAQDHERLAREVLELLNRPAGAQDVIRQVLLLIQQRTGVEAAGLRLREGDDFPYFETNGLSEDFVRAERYLGERDAAGRIVHDSEGHPMLKCMCGNILSGRTNSALPCFTSDGSFWASGATALLAARTEGDRQPCARNRCETEGYESVALIPLRSGGEIIGLLQLNDHRPHQFTLEMIRFLEGIAGNIGIALARQQAQEVLHKREGDLRLAQQIGHIGSWELDLGSNALVCSEEVYRILGCDPAAYVPTRDAFFSFVHAEDRARVQDAMATAMGGGAGYVVEYRIKRTDGTERVVTERGCFLGEARGKSSRLMGTVQDITEQKQLEAQFLRAQRLEAVGTLAAGIAHDLNNILAPILMGAPMLRQFQTLVEMAPTLDVIESNAQRAADVVRQLLTFGRGQRSQRVLLHLKHLLRDLRNVTHETFPKNVVLTVSEAPELWPLVADPTQLHQILLNLCINARDAMPEGGTLAVTATNFSVDAHFAGMTADARPGAYLRLQVSDTGTGIRPEHLEKIFDPFFTTKEEGRGTGLGLAVVHRVVTNHGGFVRVQSQMGKGTTFEVFLPASPETVAPAVPPLPALLLDGQGQLILVVDDEEHIRQTTQKLLTRHGYAAVTAGDGAEAVSFIGRHRTEVKAVVADLAMPGTDGLDLVKVLARLAPALPVVISTGAGTDPAQREKLGAIRRLGVREVLDKPYSADKLLQALHDALPPPG